MMQVMIAAPASGTGKTVVTCALLRALQQRGRTPCAFKCGPDYIDPMFHRAVIGVASGNLDLFLSSEPIVRTLYGRGCAGHDSVVCEGVMGYYDGLGGSTTAASTWALARTLDLPTVIVMRPRGASLTVAAQVKGLLEFRKPSQIVGVLFNDCSASMASLLGPVIEKECGIPVLGFLGPSDDARLSSRHLGLYTATEIDDLGARLDRLAEAMERTVDLNRLSELCDCPAPKEDHWGRRKMVPRSIRADKKDFLGPFSSVPSGPTIAVAWDEAFCFAYRETFDSLEAAGARLVPFSPLGDRAVPAEADGLYLSGGYPELHAAALAENRSMRRSVHDAIGDGMPTVAECGGYLYLCEALEDEAGNVFPQVGVLPGEGRRSERLQRFGYAMLAAREESLLFVAGQEAPVHEFHYWKSTVDGDAFAFEKPVSGRSWEAGFASPSLYAAFPHLYFAGTPSMAARFVECARRFGG